MSESWSLYPYEPNKALPIVFAVIITGLGIYHGIQTFHRYKWPRFGGMMVWATIVWLAGFITRAYSAFHQQNIPLFITQYVLILVGPPIFAAAESFILGRLFAYLPYHASLHPGRVLSTFILLATAVEVLAANGASRLSQATGGNGDPSEQANNRNVGLILIKSSLILQAIIEVFFFSLVSLLQYRCTRPGNYFPHNVKVMCQVLYITSTMMFVRCIVRVIEGFEQGNCGTNTLYCGPVQQNEWFLWVFEVANITVFVAALAVFTPGKYLSRDDKRFLDHRDGVTERQGPGFAQMDKRPFISTVLDPFHLGALIRGKEPFPRFWEEEWPVAEDSYAGRRGSLASRRLQKQEGESKHIGSDTDQQA